MAAACSAIKKQAKMSTKKILKACLTLKLRLQWEIRVVP
jgi:hypothetical protein